MCNGRESISFLKEDVRSLYKRITDKALKLDKLDKRYEKASDHSQAAIIMAKMETLDWVTRQMKQLFGHIPKTD